MSDQSGRVLTLPKRCECVEISPDVFDASDCPLHHDCGVPDCRGASGHDD